MAVTGREDLFDVEVQIWKGCDIQLEELPRAFVPSEGSRESVRFPRHLRIQALGERINLMRIPGGEHLANGV
jgi:hypothetical protein